MTWISKEDDSSVTIILFRQLLKVALTAPNLSVHKIKLFYMQIIYVVFTYIKYSNKLNKI